MDALFAHSPGNEPLVVELLQEVYRRLGLDYRNYSQTFLSRRITAFARKNNFDSIDEMVRSLLANERELESFVDSMSLPTTRMFRDPAVFKEIRESVIPMLSETQLAKVWSAGCSTGEEAYSLSIIFKEEQPGKKIITFATDLSERSLHIAKKGIYQLRRMRAYTAAYLASGGTADFSDYYTADDENAIINADLRGNLVFAQHNLVIDSTFNEFDLILCRNVLIYFDRALQEQVVNLLANSLRPGGILILGDKESIRSMAPRQNFVDLDRTLRIFQKAQ